MYGFHARAQRMLVRCRRIGSCVARSFRRMPHAHHQLAQWEEAAEAAAGSRSVAERVVDQWVAVVEEWITIATDDRTDRFAGPGRGQCHRAD